jgi:hypothetical protein
MAISSSSIASSSTLNTLRTEFNNLVTDVTALESGTISYTTLNTTTLNSTIINVKEDGTIVFEGATDDDFETTLIVVDPTADRTITFPNETGTVHTSGGDTTHTNIIIADGANIGSASDTNAMSISSGGVVSITATTANTSTTDGALTVGGGLGVAADVSIGDDLRLLSDSVVLSFGADSDTTLTHTDGTGLTLNSTNKLTFGDAASFVQQSSNGVLRIDGEATIDMNASTAVLVSNDLKLDNDGAVLGFGADNDVTLTHVHNVGLIFNTDNQLRFRDGNISIYSSADGQLDIGADDEIQLNSTLIDINANINASGTYTGAGLMTTGGNIVIPDAGTIGSATDTNAISISSGGVVNITATTASTGSTDGALTVAGGMGVAADLGVGDDIFMLSDSANIFMGADAEVSITHSHNEGLILQHTPAGDNTPMILQLRSGEAALTANEVIASLEFSGLDDSGTDATGVHAGIHAIAEAEFTSSANPTKLVFTTGVSEAAEADATAKMTLSSAGLLTIADDFMIKDGGTIGVASTNDAMTISSAGIVTFKDDILIKDGGTIGVASTVDSITMASTGAVTFKNDVTVSDDLIVTGDFTVNGDTTTINTTNKTITDATIELGNGTSGTPSNDGGLIIERGDAANAFIGFDESADKFIVGTGTFTGATTGNLSITTGTLVASLEAVTVTASGIIKTDDTTNATSTTDGSLQTDGGLSVVLDAVFGDDVKLLTDASVLSFGADSEIALTHVHNTGLLLTDSGGTPTLQLHDANESIASDGSKVIITSGGTAFSLPTADGSNGQVLKTNGSAVLSFTDVTASSLAADDLAAGDAAVLLTTSSGNITVDAAADDSDIIFKGTDGGADTTFLTIDGSDAGTLIANHNLELGTDASAILFGANNEVILTHVHDKGLALKHTATADDKPVVLTLQTGETDIAADDVIGQIDFQAPDEGTGTDAITVCAGIAAISEGDFAADNNATKLSFKCGASEAATEKMSLSSVGLLTIADDLVIKDGGTIGVASDADAITIASNGQLTLTQTLIGTALDISGDIDVDGTTNLDVVDIDGAVDMALTLAVAGVVTANAGVVVDEMTIDGDTITATDDFIIDAVGDITLDADGAQIRFKDATTERYTFNLDATPELDVTGGNFTIHTNTSDADFVVTGNDGGAAITAMTLDMSAAGAATFNNDVTAFSDERLKRDIETIPNALDKVCQMRGVTFERIDDEGSRSMGVIAQEIEKIIPEVVREDSSEEKIKSVAYGNMVGVLIEAIKELKSEVEQLKNK